MYQVTAKGKTELFADIAAAMNYAQSVMCDYAFVISPMLGCVMAYLNGELIFNK